MEANYDARSTFETFNVGKCKKSSVMNYYKSQFCKSVLAISRTASNLAACGELRRYRLSITNIGLLAEWLRHWTLNHEIVGSSPAVHLVFST